MEKYETAHIELVRIEEDVITASVTKCEPYYNPAVNSTAPNGWTVYYSDNTTSNHSGATKPPQCP